MEFIGNRVTADYCWGTRPMFSCGETSFGKPIGDKTVNYISCNRLYVKLKNPRAFDYTGWEEQGVPNATQGAVEKLHKQIHGDSYEVGTYPRAFA